jgi:HlyD family secretion protein
MDIPRPSQARQRRLRALYGGAALLAAAAVSTIGVASLKSAAPRIDRGAVWIDTVKRGPLVRDVRGIGTLVPEDIRWIPAATDGRVDRIVLRPGTPVTADSVVLELVNPQLDQELQDARLKEQAAQAALQNLRLQTENERLQQQAAAAAADAEYSKARMQADMNQALSDQRLVSALTLRQSKLDAEQWRVRSELARQQLATYQASIAARIAVQQSTLDQARAVLRLKEQQHEALEVRAGIAGILQLVPVAVGQQVATGTNLARVANPARLKAEIKIAETQARDIQIGQKATVDTRNGIVEGRVVRIDPSVQNGTRTVDVAFAGDLPKGAVPDLSVDGRIELERLADVVYVGRPSFGQEQSMVGLFRLHGDGEAARVPVKLGRMSVNAVEVISGLQPGDQVVLSDMSAWDSVERVRLQ